MWCIMLLSFFQVPSANGSWAARNSRKERNLARLDKLLHNLRGKITRLVASQQLNRGTVKVQVANFACRAGNGLAFHGSTIGSTSTENS